MRLLILLLAASTAAHSQQIPQQPRVVLLGIDSLGSSGLAAARTPNLDGLRRQGTWTMHARGVMPTSSSPNWASMIMGAGPEQHGVTSNDWMPDKFEIAPVVRGKGG